MIGGTEKSIIYKWNKFLIISNHHAPAIKGHIYVSICRIPDKLFDVDTTVVEK